MEVMEDEALTTLIALDVRPPAVPANAATGMATTGICAAGEPSCKRMVPCSTPVDPGGNGGIEARCTSRVWVTGTKLEKSIPSTSPPAAMEITRAAARLVVPG